MLRFTPGIPSERIESVRFDKSSESKDEHVIDEHAQQIYAKFNQRDYDASIFCDKPQLTDDLKILSSKYSRSFVQRLFTKCKSDSCLRFWLDEVGVKPPKDSIALVVALHNNPFVVKYLVEKGWFENFPPEEKEELLSRARRFPGEGLEYLEKALATVKPKSPKPPANVIS